MENGHVMNGTSAANNLMMVHLDPREDSRCPDDVMARRLKNRERQRRYRARKRQAADMKKASQISFSVSPSIEENQVNRFSVTPWPEENRANLIPNDFVSHVYCKRDWKKDARMAHKFKEQQASSSCPDSASGNQPSSSLPSGLDVTSQVRTEIQSKSSLIMVNTEACLSTPSSRNWKADARRKKL